MLIAEFVFNSDEEVEMDWISSVDYRVTHLGSEITTIVGTTWKCFCLAERVIVALLYVAHRKYKIAMRTKIVLK